MTSTERTTLKRRIDSKVRELFPYDLIEPRAQHAEREIAAAAGICSQCSHSIAVARLRYGALFCSTICRKRSHYWQDAERHRVKRARLVL